MSTPESKGASPAPWAWDKEWHSKNVLRSADGYTVAIYDRVNWLSRVEPEVDEPNKALLSAAPEMAAMLRKLEWAGDMIPRCPQCGCSKPEHRFDCPLNALLDRVGR